MGGVAHMGVVAHMGGVAHVGVVAHMGRVARMGGVAHMGVVAHMGGVAHVGVVAHMGGVAHMGVVAHMGGVAHVGEVPPVAPLGATVLVPDEVGDVLDGLQVVGLLGICEGLLLQSIGVVSNELVVVVLQLLLGVPAVVKVLPSLTLLLGVAHMG